MTKILKDTTLQPLISFLRNNKPRVLYLVFLMAHEKGSKYQYCIIMLNSPKITKYHNKIILFYMGLR